MSRIKLKKKKFDHVIDKPNTEYIRATQEELDKYTRIQRRWGHEHLAKEGLKLQSPNDKRVIEFLDKYFDQMEKHLKEAHKVKKKQINLIKNARKTRAVLLIMLYPFHLIRRFFKWLNKR